MGKRFGITLAFVAVLVVGTPLVMQYGRLAGQNAGERSIARIALVWPEIRSMPYNDRALLVGLAMTCRLENRAAVQSEVVACLRGAAADPDAILPKGMDRGQAQARLVQLLREKAV